jgi:hypothetical protein
MKILKNELQEYIDLLTNDYDFYFDNKIDKYNALFFPIETEGLTEDYSQTIILTELKESTVGYSNSAKPGILYDPDDKTATLAYLIVDNQQSLNLKVYVNLCKELRYIKQSYTSPLLEKDAYIINKDQIILKL